jgi:hypothetical protein
MAAGRGAGLLLVAVVLGVILLNKTDDTPTTTVTQTRSTETTRRSGGTTTSTIPTTTTIAAHDPAAVKVLPVNGTATSGVGSRAKDVLLGARYNTLAPTDAKNKPVTATVIYFAPGFQGDAAAIARLLAIPQPVIQPMPADRAAIVKDVNNVAAAHVIVVVGSDIAGTLPKSTTSSTTATTKKPASSTTTTAKATTTTAKP